MPIVSVIMPVYNGAVFIAEAIRSVFAQIFTDWELVVVDDGSTDDTPAIAANLGSRVRFMRQANQGPSAARNLGLQSATGEYVAFLDADDIWDPNFLRSLVNFLGANPSYYVAYGRWRYVDQSGNILAAQGMSKPTVITLQKLVQRNAFPLNVALVRREGLKQIGGFDERLKRTEDWDLWLRMCKAGYLFGHVPEAVANYRINPASLSQNIENMCDAAVRMLDKFYGENALTSDVLQVKDIAYGNIMLVRAAGLIANGKGERGIESFQSALKMYPVLVDNLDTHFIIACASQPRAFKGTYKFLDLREAEARLKRVLEPVGGLSRASSPARALAFLTLGRLAYGKREMVSARQFLMEALRNNLPHLYHSDTRWLILKSFVRPN